MDWSVGGDGDGYVTPVSECVKCWEVAWEEGANTVVEVPVLKFFQLEPALFLNVPIQEGELGESWRRMPAGDTHQLRFRWLKGHSPLFPHSSICSSALWRALYESGRESVGRTVAYSVVSSA